VPLDPARTVAELKELRELTGDENGAQRVAWTETWERAREWLRGKVSDTGAVEEIDEAGNQWFTLEGDSERALLLGGHIDSVPNGGWLDGCLNVMAGVEVLRRVAADGTPPLTVRLGAGYEKTDMADPGALFYGGVQPGSRLPGVPQFNVTVGGVYTRELGNDFDGFISADYSYIGNAIAPVVSGGGAEATRPGYSLANLRLGVDVGRSEISLNVHNLTNAKPNLGDIGYVGYAQFDSSGGVIPNVATLPTTTVLLQYRRSF